jgi:hypothetical protein
MKTTVLPISAVPCLAIRFWPLGSLAEFGKAHSDFISLYFIGIFVQILEQPEKFPIFFDFLPCGGLFFEAVKLKSLISPYGLGRFGSKILQPDNSCKKKFQNGQSLLSFF